MTTFYEALQRKDKELDLSILNASELEVKLAALPMTYGLSEAEDVLTKEELEDMLRKATL